MGGRTPAFARTVCVLLVGLVLLADVMAVAGELRAFINSDTAWTLAVARRLLHGERLYAHTFEINPPLVIWLHVPFVWLGDVLGVSPVLSLRLALYAGTVGSALWSARLIRHCAPAMTPRSLGTIAFAIASADLLLPMGAFSEREQVIVLLLQPFIALTAARMCEATVTAAEAVNIGIGAGVALALKPYYAAIWVLLLVLRGGGRRPVLQLEDRVVLVTGVAYVLLVLLLTPEFIPLAKMFGPAYGVFTARSRLSIALLSPETYWWLAAMLVWWLRRPRAPDAVGLVLVAASTGSLIAVVLQGKGWLYHFLPLTIFSLLLAVHATALPQFGKLRLPQRAARFAALALVLLVSAPLVSRTLAINASRAVGKTERRAEMLDLLALLRLDEGARSIMVLSSDLSPIFPLVTISGLREHISFPCQWLPMVVYRSGLAPERPTALNPPTAMSAPERFAFDATVQDLLRRPDLLLVESRARNQVRSGYPDGFDHLRYFAQSPAAAAVLHDYRVLGSARGYDLFARR